MRTCYREFVDLRRVCPPQAAPGWSARGPHLACREARRPRGREGYGSDTMDPYSILAEAISSKQQVVARYHDEERIFSPHALGTKRGVAHVLVYQYAGGSRTGLPPGGEWRCLNVEELSEIRLEPGAWRTAENVFNPQTCLDEVEVLADPLPPRATGRPPGR